MKKKIWKFSLPNDLSVCLEKYIGEIDDCVIFDLINDQKEMVGFIVDGWLTILKNYEWDGCTPKFRLFKWLVGVPDFKGTWKPSLVYDFLIEYCMQHSICRAQIDKVFEGIMGGEGFILKPVYTTGIHLFRPIALKFSSCK